MISHLDRSGPARVRYGDHDVDLVVGSLAQDLSRQMISHAQATLVHRDTVHDRVWARQVDELEQTGSVRPRRAELAPVEALSSHLIHQRLARLEVGLKGKAGGFDRNGLRGDHQLTTTFTLTKPVTKRANPVLITKRDQAKARDHRHRCVGAAAATMNPSTAWKTCSGDNSSMSSLLSSCAKTLSNTSESERVQVPAVHGEEFALELLGVCQVAVVPEDDSVGRVDIERLRLTRARGPWPSGSGRDRSLGDRPTHACGGSETRP